MWQFQERFGAVRCGETELDYLHTISLEAINAALAKYRKQLPDGVQVIPYS